MARIAVQKMDRIPATVRRIPDWLRWVSLLWLIFWFVAYWRAWGPANFLHLCDVAVILSCIGLWDSNALLLSSQAVSSVVIDMVWSVDVAARLALGRHAIGGTEYLFDGTYPMWVRMLSLFHIVMPVILIWSLSRLGYDRRGWKLQAAIALPIVIASRFVTPKDNLNFAVTDPFFHRSLGPAPVHIAITYLALLFAVYLPTHFVLMRIFPPPKNESQGKDQG
jgi:hypothetical protein